MNSMTFWGRDENDERLLVECLLGVKTATCTPKVWYDALDEMEKGEIGDQFEVYTKKGVHACKIEVTDKYEIAFGDIRGEIGEKIAAGENSTLDQFIKDHIFTWKEALLKDDIVLDDNTIIIVEHFQIVEAYIDFKELGHKIEVLL